MDARQNLIKFILSKNWILLNEGSKFDLFLPPRELGFEENYKLPIPKLFNTEDYENILHDTIKFVIELYDLREEEFYEKSTGYFNTLLNNAIYFKLNSENIRYEKTLEVNEIWNFLKNLSTSYTNYVSINFAKHFSRDFGYDAKRTSTALGKFLNLTKLRVVALEYHSFSFGVSSDTIMGSNEIQNKDISIWRKNLVKSYNNDVIDIDYNSPEILDFLASSYNENERRLIYTPIIKSINNPSNYTITLTNKNFKPLKSIKRLSKQNIDYILPKNAKEIDDNESKINFIRTIIPVDSSKNIIKLNVAELEEENLFTQKLEEITGRIEELNLDHNIKVKLKVAIDFALVYNPYTAMFTVHTNEPWLEFNIKNFNNLQKEFDKKITELIHYCKANKEPKSEYDKNIYIFLSTVLPEDSF